MKKIIIILTFILALSSCSDLHLRNPAHKEQTPNSNYVNLDFQKFIQIYDQSLIWRKESLDFIIEYNKNGKQQNMSHANMMKIKQNVKAYLELRNNMFELANEFNVDLVVNKNLIEENKILNNVMLRNKFNMTLSLILSLYDNYMMGIYPLYSDLKTRKMIKFDIPEIHNEIEKINLNFLNLSNRLDLIKRINIFKNENLNDNNYEEKFINNSILNSSFYVFIQGDGNLIQSRKTVKTLSSAIFDSANFLKDVFTYTGSKFFGNSVGLVAFREGLLKNLNSEQKSLITSKLKPLDILLEKTPFRLTDTFIPGYYGHVAIWIGTKKELEEIGIWDHPVVAKYHNEILAGKRIIEALRPGVQINSLEHFLDIDDLLALRNTTLSKAEIQDSLLRAFSQIGKEYDFNFDVETDDKIVCSEIAYVVFHDIKWPTQKSLGRYTISPDHVASQALGNNPKLSPVLLYKSGNLVESNLLEELKNIMGK